MKGVCDVNHNSIQFSIISVCTCSTDLGGSFQFGPAVKVVFCGCMTSQSVFVHMMKFFIVSRLKQ